MGGRGASSGISNKNNKYGTQYTTILKHGNIKFIVRNKNGANAPLETMTNQRIYVTIGNSGEPKFISFYDKRGKRSKTIDLDKMHHKNIGYHTHNGYMHEGSPKALTKSESNLVDRVMKIWYDNKANK